MLAHYQVPYEEHHHPPVYSSSHLAHAEHVSGHRVAKTILLAADRRPLAVVLPACAHLDLAHVQAVLGARDLRFAAEGEIAAWFKGCQSGCVPPFRLRSDLRIMMDRSLAHLGKILFPAGAPDAAVSVRFSDWYRAVRPGVGRFTAASNGNGRAHKPTVLVVEDETVTNRLLCQLLEQKGFTCHGAEDGSQALAKAVEVQPAALLLDLMLPDRSGFEVYEQLRRTGPLKPIPFIVVTALDDERSRQRSWQLGADAYLTKPFYPDQLVSALHGVLADAHA
jgi:Ala-tRNA(Pro) deacylase